MNDAHLNLLWLDLESSGSDPALDDANLHLNEALYYQDLLKGAL